jgi:hypothetical protein
LSTRGRIGEEKNRPLPRESSNLRVGIRASDKPADLPVQQSTKVELFLNLKTAKALGITVPLKLIGRSHDVIE